MALKSILTSEDPVLQKKSRPVVDFDEKLWDLLDDLKETLVDSNGLGLAAPQIGILRRVVLIVDTEGEILELINPQIIHREGEQEGLEGCLSLPGLWGKVLRPMTVTVEAQNRTGTTFQVTGTGLVARCFCHEIDHLEGILYTNYCDKTYTSQELEELEELEESEEIEEQHQQAQTTEESDEAEGKKRKKLAAMKGKKK